MKININKKKAKKSNTLNKSIDKYIEIMSLINTTKFDDEFKKMFSAYYRITHYRDVKWQNSYYKIFKKYRNKRDNKVSFDIKDILSDIYKATKNVEFSFASKMLHSLYSKKYPIYDSLVAKELKLEKMPSKKSSGDYKDRINKACEIYKCLIDNMKEYNYLVKVYDDMFEDKKISDLKKKDFLIWWHGKTNKEVNIK